MPLKGLYTMTIFYKKILINNRTAHLNKNIKLFQSHLKDTLSKDKKRPSFHTFIKQIEDDQDAFSRQNTTSNEKSWRPTSKQKCLKSQPQMSSAKKQSLLRNRFRIQSAHPKTSHLRHKSKPSTFFKTPVFAQKAYFTSKLGLHVNPSTEVKNPDSSLLTQKRPLLSKIHQSASKPEAGLGSPKRSKSQAAPGWMQVLSQSVQMYIDHHS